MSHATRVEEVHQRNQIQAARNDLAVEAFAVLARAKIKRCEGALRTCTVDQLAALQGEIRGYEQVLKWITEPLTVAKATE